MKATVMPRLIRLQKVFSFKSAVIQYLFLCLIADNNTKTYSHFQIFSKFNSARHSKFTLERFRSYHSRYEFANKLQRNLVI